MTDPSMSAAPQTNSPGRGRRWWILLLLVVLVGGATYFYLRRSAGNAQQNPPSQDGGRHAGAAKEATPVVAADAKKGDIDVYLNGLGAVTPLSTVTIKTHVDGELMKVLFSEGQTVKEGQFIAEIDPRPYQVLLEQAEGQMAHDLALLKNAQVDLERYRTLFKQDSIAEQQLATQDALVRKY
jgi:multidrug efflux system membrane fusion protein